VTAVGQAPDSGAANPGESENLKGSRMQRFSVGRWLGGRWMVLVAVGVLVVAGLVVFRLHGVFASRDVTSTPNGAVNDVVPFNPKRVVIEVFGPPGTVATITYMDVDASPQRVDGARLPWVYDTSTTQPAVAVNVSAQGDSGSIGCRITIDGEVKDQRTVRTPHAFTYCLDKSG
jgi:hypothetical protein